MRKFHFWAITSALALALVGGNVAWSDPGEEPGDAPPAPGDGGMAPTPPDELGGTETPPPPAEPPAQPPADPPVGTPPPADPPPTPPPDDPVVDTPEDPADGSVDAEIAAKKAAKEEAARIALIVSNFNKKMKGATPELQMAALTEVSSTKHPLVAAALIPWIQPTVDNRVRSLALECAKSQRYPEMGRAAAALLEKNSADILYARALIAIMGRSKDKAQVAKLRQLLKGKDHSLEIQKEAVAALGQIGGRDAIPDLIQMYKEFENPHLSPKEIPRRDALQKLTEAALDLITGTHNMDGKGWDRWWKANEKTFGVTKAPEAPK